MNWFSRRLRTVSAISACLFLFPNILNAAPFAYGADVSWLPQMETQGFRFYDDNGVQKECLQILKEHGINAVRLRVFVNPSANSCSGHCGKAETVAMAGRAAKMGLRVMIDFHYSDSWADPGRQTKPAVWADHTFSQLCSDIYNHTFEVLDTLIKSGVRPEWVQVGNETNDGMLWETGRASSGFSNFAAIINSGYDAVKAADSSIKVIVHISNGYDAGLYRWMFDSLQARGARYDVIGMSLYPDADNWDTLTEQCLANMNAVSARYGKEVIIAETGMDHSSAAPALSMLTGLIAKTMSVTNGKGIGVFYWEPECYNWCNYSMGAWDASGRPTAALDAFQKHTRLANTVAPLIEPQRFSATVHGRSVYVSYRIIKESSVKIRVFEMTGRKAAEIHDKIVKPGSYLETVGLTAHQGVCVVSLEINGSVFNKFICDKGK